MAKGDQDRVQNNIDWARNSAHDQMGAGINDTNSRVNELTGRSDAERNNVNSSFQGLRDDGGINASEAARLRGITDQGIGVSDGGASSGGVGAGAGSANAQGTPDYITTWQSLLGDKGGFDPTRLSNIDSSSASLRNSGSKYGATDTAIKGLNEFGVSGGITDEDMAQINRPLFDEFERTGGYSENDKSNIRNRTARGVGSLYQNLSDTLKRNRAASGAYSPDAGSSTLRLARQSAQDQGSALRDSEIGLSESIRQGRMAAADEKAQNQLKLIPTRTANQLAGYTGAGSLDLTRQKQIDDAMAAAAGIDLSAQGLINQTRLGAAGGLSGDTLGRMSIASSSSAANAALALQRMGLQSQNERFLIGQTQQGRATGAQGLLDTYKAAPGELLANQDLLYNYRMGLGNQNQGLINSEINNNASNQFNMSNLSMFSGLPGMFQRHGDTPTGPAQGWSQNQDSNPVGIGGTDQYGPNSPSQNNGTPETGSTWYPDPGPNGPDDGANPYGYTYPGFDMGVGVNY